MSTADFASLMQAVAEQLLGQPAQKIPSKKHWHYGNGSQGSVGDLVVDLGAGTWFDHEHGKGGGVLDLIARENGGNRETALEWLRENISGADDALKPNGHGKARTGKLGRIIATYDYRDEAGRLQFQVCRFEPKDFRQRHPDASAQDGWSWKVSGFVEPIPYRLPELIAAPKDATVYIAEGEKDADRLGSLGLVATTNPGGAGKGKWLATFAQWFDGRNVVILPDNDAGGRKHAKEVAANLAPVAALVRIVTIPDLPAKGDVSNWLDAGGTVEALAELVEATQPYVDAEPDQGDPFDDKQPREADPEVEERGNFRVRYRNPAKGQPVGLYVKVEGEWSWFCSLVKVVAHTRSDESVRWGRWLAAPDLDGVVHTWAMPMSLLAGDGREVIATLYDLGVRLRAGPKPKLNLLNYLTEWTAPERIRVTDRIGWHGEVAFVLPDEVVGCTGTEELKLQREGRLPEYKLAGTLASWRQNIAAPATGNTLVVFSVSLGFMGPLLLMVGEESGGFHLRGLSSTGKTAALYCACSVWGLPAGSWRMTDNAGEWTAADACDTLMTLDELGQGDAKAVGEMAYMWANGAGKRRMTRGIKAREQLKWRVPFLSTGEVSLATKLEEKGGRAYAGQEVRCLDIAADMGAGWGIYEDLHDYADGADLSEHFRAAYQRHCGHVGREFLKHLLADYAANAAKADQLRKQFITDYCPAGCDGQVRRACGRFAVVAAAGEMATGFGLTGWEQGTATAAAKACFERWVGQRGGIIAAEVMNGVRQVRAILESDGAARCQPAWEHEAYAKKMELDGKRAPPPPPTHRRIGFRRTTDGATTYYILAEAWRGKVCKGFDSDMVARFMAERGWLLRGEGSHIGMKVRIPDHGMNRVYVISPDFMTTKEIEEVTNAA